MNNENDKNIDPKNAAKVLRYLEILQSSTAQEIANTQSDIEGLERTLDNLHGTKNDVDHMISVLKGEGGTVL